MSHYYELTGLHAEYGAESLTHLVGSTEPVNFDEIMGAQYIDTSGIPLLSDRAPEDLTSGIDFKYRQCPYKDSPSRVANTETGTDIPMSGLEQERLRTHFKEVLAIAMAFRTEVDQGRRGPLNNAETGLTFGMLKYLPHYLVFRAEHPVAADQLEPRIIIASNSASGSLGALFAGIEATGKPEVVVLFDDPDTEVMIAASEARGSLIGEKTVCAASPGMMRGFINAVVKCGDAVLISDVLAGLMSETELPRLASMVDAIQTIDHIMLGRYGHWTYTDDKKREIDEDIKTIQQSNKRARNKGVLIEIKRMEQKQLDEDLVQADLATQATIQTYNERINIALGRNVRRKPKPAPFILPGLS